MLQSYGRNSLTNTESHFRAALPGARNPAVLSGVLDPVRDSVFPVSSGDEFVARMTSVVTLWLKLFTSDFHLSVLTCVDVHGSVDGHHAVRGQVIAHVGVP